MTANERPPQTELVPISLAGQQVLVRPGGPSGSMIPLKVNVVLSEEAPAAITALLRSQRVIE